MSFSMNRMGGLSGLNIGSPATILEQVNDPFWQNVVLYTRMEADPPTDLSISAHTLTSGSGLVLDTSVFRFGASSVDLRGATVNDYVTSADNADWDLGASPFTIDCWFRFGTDVDTSFVSQCEDTGNQIAWNLDFETTGNTIRFRWTTDGSTVQTISGAFTPATNQWYHIVVQRDEVNDIRIFIDGQQIAVGNTTDTFHNSTGDLRVGVAADDGGAPQGWFDEVRITKGVARYG